MNAVDLSDRERAFCESYVIDFNGSRASRDVGIADSNANKWAGLTLAKPEVLEYIEYLKAQKIKRARINADYVLDAIHDTVERCRQEVVPVLTKKGRQVTIETKEGEDALAYTFDSRGALKGLELLGKHFAMFTDVVDNKHTFTQMPDVRVPIPGTDGEMKALEFDVGAPPDGARRIARPSFAPDDAQDAEIVHPEPTEF